jgi:hypothetical protein
MAGRFSDQTTESATAPELSAREPWARAQERAPSAREPERAPSARGPARVPEQEPVQARAPEQEQVPEREPVQAFQSLSERA